eukprot:13973129-Alexandrium_andersonii.AAC.1
MPGSGGRELPGGRDGFGALKDLVARPVPGACTRGSAGIGCPSPAPAIRALPPGRAHGASQIGGGA